VSTSLAPPHAKRILVIEDNADMAQMLCDYLVQQGHTLESASTAEQGIAKAHEFRPEVLLVDLVLPDLHGTDVAKRVRLDPQLKHAWLVAVTAYSLEDEAAKVGFDAYFLKPVDFEQLALHLRRELPAR
jgi:CheY-like chemotaxis protein